jgi:hypothetical protein
VKPPFDILYCHVRRNTKNLSAGHWFFHTGQFAVCAQAGRHDDGYWRVLVYWDRPGKESPEGKTFDSIDEVVKFVSAYFEQPVVKVKASQLPRADE